MAVSCSAFKIGLDLFQTFVSSTFTATEFQIRKIQLKKCSVFLEMEVKVNVMFTFGFKIETSTRSFIPINK